MAFATEPPASASDPRGIQVLDRVEVWAAATGTPDGRRIKRDRGPCMSGRSAARGTMSLPKGTHDTES